jgi:hypothetical protein
MSLTRRAAIGLASLVATSVAAGLLGAPLAAATGSSPDAKALTLGSGGDPTRAQAQATLAAAQALFGPTPMSARSAEPADDATLVMRDLARAVPALGPAGRRAAHELLARPSDPTSNDSWGRRSTLKLCNARLCVRWTNKGVNAPPRADTDRDGVPNQVERTLAVANEVWSTEVGALHYRRPLTDQRASFDSKDRRFDIYLAALSRGLYGYCAPDDSRMKRSSTYRYYDVAAYCVLDDDYARFDFPSGTPLSNLQVTAAHEFQHAIQFGYDVSEDAWIMESTATWMEDQVYDGSNDNRQYLTYSQLNRPNQSLDLGKAFNWYGNWIFFRWLSEHYGPSVVRQVWGHLDASPTGTDDYSTLGIANALTDRGVAFGDAYARFTADNQSPSAWYEEGAAYDAGPAMEFGLSNADPDSGLVTKTLDHLTSAAVRFVPGPGVGAATLDLTIDVPDPASGGRAVLIETSKDGTVTSDVQAVAPDGSLTLTAIPFDPADVASVTVVLVNAGARVKGSTCFRYQTLYACGGAVSLSDGGAASVRGQLG